MKLSRKNTICLLLTLIIAAATFGCSGSNDAVPEMTLSSYVPSRETEPATFTAQLYFVSDDGLRLSVEEREVRYTDGMSRAEAAIRALIDGPESTVLNRSVPVNMLLQRVEPSYDTCNVYLLSSYTPDAREWMTARAAIAATVYACEGIGSVNLYLNGMAPAYYGRAMGASTPISSTLDSYIVGLQQEFKEIADGIGTEAGVYETRLATLYFTDSEGKLLIAKNTVLNYDSSEGGAAIAALLINKLLDGADELEAVLPADMTLQTQVRLVPEKSFSAGETVPGDSDIPHPGEIIQVEPEQQEDLGLTQGEPMIAEVLLRKPDGSYNENTVCGAVTLTLTGYIPDIQGVAISVIDDDGVVTSLSAGEYFTRDDFSGSIGQIVYMAYPSSEGNLLYRVSRAVPGVDSYDPMALLRELLAGPAGQGVSCGPFTEEDIKDVYKTGSTVVVDWKAGFAEKLRQYIADDSVDAPPKDTRERMFIYSVVNTLTEIEGIGRVWMLEDGKKLGSIGELYLGNSLMRNPGILVDE